MMATDQDEKPRDDDYPDIVPEDPWGSGPRGRALVANFLPGLGGAIANVRSGWSAERKRERGARGHQWPRVASCQPSVDAR
jgi:hypothetical protein